MSHFANGNILLTPSRFIRQCKMNIQNFVSTVMLGAIQIGFKTSIWCCILTLILFWLNNGRNADPYVTKLSNLSSTRECDDDPEGTQYYWFGPISFQSNVMNHRWLWIIYVKTKSHVYMYIKKTSKNFPGLLIFH